MTGLYRLVYASKNLLEVTEAEMLVEVEQILQASHRNNAKVDVTGALMFNRGAFAQVLEGPRRGVEATFERIQRDIRHADVTVLQCGPAAQRGFSNWSMAFVGQSEKGKALWSGMAARSGFDFARLEGDDVFAMLHGLVMEEEGVPAVAVATLPMQSPELDGVAAVKDQATPPLDAAKVRTELATIGRQDQTKALPLPSARASSLGETSHGEVVAAAALDAGGALAALDVIRAALASERQRTTELRHELDEARIALAHSESENAFLHKQRVLWAESARRLAAAIEPSLAATTFGRSRIGSVPQAEQRANASRVSTAA